jgi:hypothetical protein
MDCLSNLKLEAPTGTITLDENRQAIGSNFVTEVQLQADGTLQNVPVKKVDNVNQTLGLSPEAFKALGLPSRENPECKASY